MPTVKLFANLRKLSGMKEVSISGSSLEMVLNELVTRNPALNGVILEKGELRPHVDVTLNGHNAVSINEPVTEQDVIAIFPPIAGGTSPLTPVL